jgi:aspartate kinase
VQNELAKNLANASFITSKFQLQMRVFKFGGASINSVERIRKLATIIQSFSDQKMLVVISAMGKTTNALEKVTDAFFNNKSQEAISLLEGIMLDHLRIAEELIGKDQTTIGILLRGFFTEIDWLLQSKPHREFDYYYDQIVSVGELLSSTIISFLLNKEAISNQWIDVRDIFRTDDNFRDAGIDWDFTQNKVRQLVLPLFDNTAIIITQGFIGSTDENESTTLGREGSDYSAAVFANMLDAGSLSIWKDVKGVMNADPKEFPEAQLISELDYDEVIEMAFYGAQVIHPKTVKPLQNKGIPLIVKCFLDKDLPGTLIHTKKLTYLPPILVLKQNQSLLHFHSKDFSFVGEKPIAELYHLFSSIRIKPGLIQSGAVTLMVCLDERPEKIEKLIAQASTLFDVQVEKGLTLLTIRHYREDVLDRLTRGKQIILRQQSPETVQVLMRKN